MSTHLPILERPRTRGDCVDAPRPCPWVSCRHHLGIEVTHTGRVRETGAWESCSLDVADRGEHSEEEVAGIMGVTRQAVQQWRAEAIRHMRKHYR